MVNKFRLSLLFLVLLSGCKYFEPQVLDDSHQLAVDEGEQKGLPVLANNDGYIDHFGGDIAIWWSASPDLILTKKGDTMRIESKNVGSKYVPFGRTLPALDFSEAPVLKIRMRYEGRLAPEMRVDLQDIYGKSADGSKKFRLKKGDYRDYYFSFDGKWKQFWPDAQPVDSRAINKISIFLNPGGADWTGTVYIDEIKAVKVSDIPAKKSASAAPVNPPPAAPATEESSDNNEDSKEATSATPATTTDADAAEVKNTAPAPTEEQFVLIDDFSKGIDPWWSGSESKIKISKEGENLKVALNEAGPAYETFGRGFKKIDFTKTPIIKLRLMAKCEKPASLRVDIKDAQGFSTNAKPIAMKLEPGTDFVELYYDFTGKFEQAWPNVQKVTPEDIVEILLFVNPGGTAFRGILYIDEIKAISLEDFKNKK